MTQVIEKPVESPLDSDDYKVSHYYCPKCHPEGDVSWCGMDITEHDFVGDEEIDCVVCVDMDQNPEKYAPCC